MRLTRRIVVTSSLIAIGITGIIVVAPIASATGDYGNDTCVEGYVWREAVPIDHVCVTPSSRGQAWSDNAEAANRVEPGTDTCLPGYVWRDAVHGNPYAYTDTPADHVCVPPDIRDQTAWENNPDTWGTRLLFMEVAPDPASTSDSLVLAGRGFNVGWVYVAIKNSDDDSLIWDGWAYSSPDTAPFPGTGNGFTLQTPLRNCNNPAGYSGWGDSYIVSYDSTAGRWNWTQYFLQTRC